MKKYVESPINYSGGKYKLLKQIMPLFPNNINTFFDVFAGGMVVGVNAKFQKLVANDIQHHVIELFNYINNTGIEEIIDGINKIVNKYHLSNTKKYGYHFYNTNSSQGLQQVNKQQYQKLRDDYNLGTISEDKNLVFYVLLIYSFNNQIRFNSTGKFNIPIGKRDFNIRMETKLRDFKTMMTIKNIEFTCLDFRDFLNRVKDPNDFVYLDPPYLISTASYNEDGKWTELDERSLLDELDKLNDRGIRFALSNVIIHKGRENKILKEWSLKYKVYYLEFNYNNSNYQSSASKYQTVEVLITNY